MSTLPVRVDDGWLLACVPCGWEHFTSARAAAERVAREHDRKQHPAAGADRAGVAGLFDLEETR